MWVYDVGCDGSCLRCAVYILRFRRYVVWDMDGMECGVWCLGYWWLSSVVYGVWFVVWCLDIGMYDVAFVLFIL